MQRDPDTRVALRDQVGQRLVLRIEGVGVDAA